MRVAEIMLLLAAGWPMWLAWRATASTTLRPSVIWLLAAWAAWLSALETGADGATYLALSLSGCAGVAVLGARRPGVGAWNFVLGGLLAVLLLPVARGWGTPRVELVHLLFLGATLAVPVFNYLPTRMAPAVLLVGVGCAFELARLTGFHWAEWQHSSAHLCLAAGPWMGLLVRRRAKGLSAFERIWLEFRDGFGFVWGQPAREQFNRAAENAGWAVSLHWRGIARTAEGTVPGDGELLRTLTAVLKRFGPE